MTVSERPLYGQVDIKRLANLWTEKRRNLDSNPRNKGTATNGVAPTRNAYIFDGTGSHSISGEFQRATATSFAGNGSTTQRVGVRTNPNFAPVPMGTPIRFSFDTENLALPAGVQARVYVDALDGPTFRASYNSFFVPNGGRISGSVTSSTGQITSLQFYVWIEPTVRTTPWSGTATVGFSKLLIEAGPAGAYFDGDSTPTGDELRTRWIGTPNASQSITETQRAYFIKNATKVSIRRGGTRTGIGTKTDVGIASFTLLNDEDPMQGGTLDIGQTIQIVADSEPIFTGRITDIASGYPLVKATGEERTTVNVTVSDAVQIHATTPRYGAMIGAPYYETFEQRATRYAGSSLAPIEPPPVGTPRVVYSF